MAGSLWIAASWCCAIRMRPIANMMSAPLLVVELGALTVAVRGRLATAMRAKLNTDAATLPLAKILEGGTWAAGRAIAQMRRADGSAPLKVVSDGTVF